MNFSVSFQARLVSFQAGLVNFFSLLDSIVKCDKKTKDTLIGKQPTHNRGGYP